MDANIRLYLEKKFDANGDLLPDHMHQAMKMFLFDRIEPGSFLTAVLCNDLRGAIGRADHINKRKICDIVSFCMNVLPAVAWGSEDRVRSWLDQPIDGPEL